MESKNEEATVLIMMATYNGEIYLKKQIDSIISQTYKNWKLIIQDDGSTDKTLSIIDNYCHKDKRIIKENNTSSFHGPYINFNSLANKCKNIESYDYYMFCDQDDIWDDNKIEWCVKIGNKNNKDKPFLYYANMRIIDGNDNLIGRSVNESLGMQYTNPTTTLFAYKVWGCNCFMNKAAFYSVPLLDFKYEKYRILCHDNLYAKFAAFLGKIVYEDNCLMSYRRHSSNASSSEGYSKYSIKRVTKRILDIESLAKAHAHTYNQSLITIDMLMNQHISSQNKEQLNKIKNVIYSGGPKALFFVIQNNVDWGNEMKNISRKFILLTGIYKKYLINYK